MMQLVSQTYFLPKHPCVYTVSSLLMIDMHIVIVNVGGGKLVLKKDKWLKKTVGCGGG